MSNNDIRLFDELLKRSRSEQDPTSSESEFFHFFSAQQVLRDYQLDPEEIKSGIVGGESGTESPQESDGGIDSMYLIVNNRLIRDTDEAGMLKTIKHPSTLDLIFIQSKLESGFELFPLIRFGDTAESIFDISRRISELGEHYNGVLLDIIERFREAYYALIPCHPEIRVFFYYVAKADAGAIHPGVLGKALEIEKRLQIILTSIASISVTFVGARELYGAAKRPQKFLAPLSCVSSMADGKGGTIAFAEMGEYYKMITRSDKLRDHLFDSNVRDYHGDAEVNQQIRDTLESSINDNAGFWWLNNGITILADRVQCAGQHLEIEEPRIVNGLQTSREIFHHLRKPTTNKADPRLLAIRVIQSPDDALRDRIIRASNTQSKIPLEFLRATDEIQRDIEEAFRARGLHYDRRKNSWRDSGLPLNSVVGMSELAQSVAAIILREPNHARARPSRYFTKGFYGKVFKEATPLQTYIVCAQLRKRTEAFLKNVEPNAKHRDNLLFYCLMVLGYLLKKIRINNKTQSFAEIDVAALPDESFGEALAIVRPIYKKCGGDDKAAKGREIAADLRSVFSKKKKRPKAQTT